ncbi:hypothetical protein I3760_05G230900 [Carya illinoinensis]|nr:hypothetical protein I3760_05G230900 [Carya illinoinensis]
MIATLLLLQLPQTFCLKTLYGNDHYCNPSSITASSCPNHSIRYPFRLKGEATNCSAETYELSCENNHSLLFYSDLGGKYYVQQINYYKQTIRLVDSEIQEDNFSFIPRFIINYSNLSRLQGPMDYDWYGTSTKGVAIVNCEKPVMSSTSYLLLETSSSTCSNNNIGKTKAGDVEGSCKIEQMFLTSWPGPNAHDSNITISCADLRNVFLSVFELRWFNYSTTGLWHGALTVLGTPFVEAFDLSMYDAIEEFLQNHNNLMKIRYSFSEVKKMTKNFKEKLGEGDYGTSKANGQEFTNEVATIGRIHHVNVVQLIGFWFMPHGSLNKHIFSLEGSILLSCEETYNIALGVARGIKYLHLGCDMQILHFDIKPHNILLDENFIPKVSDFGLAKLYQIENNTISLTIARGTLGYMAPELFYKNIGGISYKADVYSFGMLLMEMVSKRKNVNAFVYDQFNNKKDIEMGYATEEEKEMTMKMMIVALWCIQTNPNNRPSMNKVVEMLEGEVEHLQIPPKPPLSSQRE